MAVSSRSLLAAAAAAALLASLIACSSLSEAATWQDATGRNAIVLPLSRGYFNRSLQSDLHRGRQLAEARVWLHGHVLTQGYYYTRASFGTPPQPFALIVDTGSSMTYVPCASCTRCGTHQDAPFNPAESSTYEEVPCSSSFCEDASSCDGRQRCVYSRHYAEESSTNGYLASDSVHFGEGSNMPPTKVVFGCETGETGDLYTQRADGIIALGKDPMGIVDQLVQNGAMDDSFTLCYGGMEDGGGSMILGASFVPQQMMFTQFDPAREGSPYYNVILEEIRVNGAALPISRDVFEEEYGSVLDSGTTFTYLPKAAFFAFKQAIVDGVRNLEPVAGPDPNYDDVCFGGAGDNYEDLQAFFPKISILFGGDVLYELSPENFLFRHRSTKGAYCLGFFQNGHKSNAGTLLGGILTRNTMVTYDRANGQVGFLKIACNNMFEELNRMEGVSDRPLPKHLPPAEDDIAEPPEPSEEEEEGELTPENCHPACTARIIVLMTIAIPLPSFENLSPVFVMDLQREVQAEPAVAEVLLDDYDKIEPSDSEKVNVTVVIVPRQTEIIPGPLAEQIRSILLEKKMALRDAFEDYTVQSVTFIPYPPAPSSSNSYWIPLIAVLSVVVLVGIIIIVVIVRRNRQRKEGQKYLSMEEAAHLEPGLEMSHTSRQEI